MGRFGKPLILAATLGLASCAVANVGRDYSLAGRPGTGLVVMSLTHTVSSATLAYQPLGGGSGAAFMTGSARDPMDWQSPRGRLVVAELPAGRYQFHEWRASVGSASMRSRPFSIPFVVTEGRATYIGNVFLDIDTSTRAYKVSVKDMAGRDLPLLRERYRKVRAADVITAIARLSR